MDLLFWSRTRSRTATRGQRIFCRLIDLFTRQAISVIAICFIIYGYWGISPWIKNTSFGSSITIIQTFSSVFDFGFCFQRKILFFARGDRLAPTLQRINQNYLNFVNFPLFSTHSKAISACLVPFNGNTQIGLNWSNWILIDFCEHSACAFACFLRFLVWRDVFSPAR